MERLGFEDAAYSAVESSIHLCRYLPARALCSGKRVLDIACGEGYGSALLADWGAAAVTGVDVSEQAVSSAKRNFSRANVDFKRLDAENERELLPSSFDLIVCLETVEHVDDPHTFLKNLKSYLAPRGQIIISCPNDHWYYRQGGGNPYHKTRWTFEEFRMFSEEVLGAASAWYLGTFFMGYGSVEWQKGTAVGASQKDMLLARYELQASLVAPQSKSAPNASSCSYYMGVWGAPRAGAALEAFCGYPASMDFDTFGENRIPP